MKENETPKGIVNQLESVSVSLSAFIELNNTRFFAGKLKAASKLRKGTKLLIPTNEMGDRKSSSSLPPLPLLCAAPFLRFLPHSTERGCTGGEFTDGEVVATNYSIWLVQHSDGEVTELIASEVQEAVWCYRRINEGWSIATDAPHIGARVRRVFPEQKDPQNPDQPYCVNGTLVGYLPPGENEDDFAMWHMVHDGGDDDEDLEAAEVEEGIKCYEEFKARPVAPVKPTAAPSSKQEPSADDDAPAEAAAEAADKGTKKADKGAKKDSSPPVKKKRDPKAPKGPLSSFNFFHIKVRADMTKENPEETTFSVVGRRAAELWREMDVEAKAPYAALAEKDKLRYAAEMATYVPPPDISPPPKRRKGAQSAGENLSTSSESESESESESSDSESESESESEADSEEDAEEADTRPKAYDAEWAELDAEQRDAAGVLGYSEEQWQRKEVPPACVGSHWEVDPEVVRTWEELSPEQLEAARRLGYEKWEWDNAMRDGVLPADDAATSMFLVGEECFAFDAEGRAYQAVVKETRITTATYVPSPAKKTLGDTSSTADSPSAAEMPGAAAADATAQHSAADPEPNSSPGAQPSAAEPGPNSSSPRQSKRWEYFIHYKGWKPKWDVWMTNESIFKKNPENAKLCGDQGDVSKGPSGFKKEKAKVRQQAQAKKEKERRRQQKAKKRALKAAKQEAKAARKAAKLKAKKARAEARRAASKRKRSTDGSAADGQSKPKRIRPPKITEDRVRRNSSEAQAARQVQQTQLPEILAIQLSQDYEACHGEQKVIELPRRPSVAELLEEFTTAKLKSIQSKLSKEHRTGADHTTARSTLLVGTGIAASAQNNTSPPGGAARDSSADGTSPDGADDTDGAALGKSAVLSKKGMTSMQWSEEENLLLLRLVEQEGASNWPNKAETLGTKRSGEAVYKHYKALVKARGLEAPPTQAPPKKLERIPDAKALAATIMDAEELAQHREQCQLLIAPWEELCRGLREFFNAALLPFLLFKCEREQAEQLRRIYPESNEQDFASLYGPEHMLRLLVQLPVRATRLVPV